MLAVLVLLPPSESKHPPPEHGAPVDLERLSFPQLAEVRARVLDALIKTSARPDALTRLMVGASLAGEVERNTRLLDLPARPALEVYRGTLYETLGAATLSGPAARRAQSEVVVVSPLWGAVRPADGIPTYRLNICAALVGLPALEPMWREVLVPVLTDAAGRRGAVLDCRSSSYRAVGTPSGLDDRTATVRVRRPGDDRRPVGAAVGKRTRGEVVRHLLHSGADPDTPQQLAEALADRFDVKLVHPSRPSSPWSLEVMAA